MTGWVVWAVLVLGPVVTDLLVVTDLVMVWEVWVVLDWVQACPQEVLVVLATA